MLNLKRFKLLRAYTHGVKTRDWRAALIKKANKRLFFLVQLKRENVHVTDIINSYCACIRPVLARIWSTAISLCPEYLQKNLERVQKPALSFF